MCRRHESTLAGTTTAPASARRFVARECADLDVPELAETAKLLTSELVTNAVVHANGETTVGVAMARGHLVVDVRDDDPRLPEVRDVESEHAHGRGLALVSMLADDWGVDPLPRGGKAIWFALSPRRLPAYAETCNRAGRGESTAAQ